MMCVYCFECTCTYTCMLMKVLIHLYHIQLQLGRTMYHYEHNEENSHAYLFDHQGQAGHDCKKEQRWHS